jgi:hypothetical protein
VPFITHGGYGLGQSLTVLAEHAREARIIEGFPKQADQERETLTEVTAGYKEFSYLNSLPATRQVSKGSTSTAALSLPVLLESAMVLKVCERGTAGEQT